MALDISAVGARVSFSNGLNLEITEFSDEGTPFDAPDVDVSTNAKNLNGTMISSRTPSVYPFSVTVIPGSLADITLAQFFADSAIQPGNNSPSTAKWCDCEISIPAGVQSGDGASGVTLSARYARYTRCRAKNGPTGPSTSAEGRLAARTYSFEAEGYKPM